MWCGSTLDAEFIERMEELLELYERPLDPAEPVVCLDERPVRLHDEKRQRVHAQPGRAARYDYEYVRRGTANIFCAIEPRAGKHITKVTSKRSSSDFAKMLMEIARRYPKAKTIHLVMDNLSTHFLSSLIRHYGEERGRALWSRFTVHYTPKHGSWLNQAEIEISILNRQCIGTQRFETQRELKAQVQAWNRRANAQRIRFRWAFTTEKAREKFRYEPIVFSRSED